MSDSSITRVGSDTVVLGNARFYSPLLVFLCLVLIVFYPHVLGSNTFIGDSDRLNSYLNIRLAEFDSLREYGRVAGWSNSMFGGFSLAGLHWMNPGRDPITYFLQLFSRDEIFVVLGYVSALFVFAACATAYFYILDVTGKTFPATAGGAAYGLSVFSLHRIAQSDVAHLTVVLIPVGLLALRRVKCGSLFGPFCGLALIMSCLAFWGFLQEVAYAFLFFGVYALSRCAAVYSTDRRSALAILLVMVAASCVAGLIAAPRLVVVGDEFAGMARSGAMVTPNSSELLRLFHEGIFGRFYAEGKLLGNRINLHEGLQLLSSCMLSLFVCWGMTRPKTYLELLGASLIFALMLCVVLLVPAFAFRFSDPDSAIYSVRLAVVLVTAIPIALALWLLRMRPRQPTMPGQLAGAVAVEFSERGFHLLALGCLLLLVIVGEGRSFLYVLFGRADFTHTRLSILMILPLCTLLAIYLVDLIAEFGPSPASRRASVHIGWLIVALLSGGGFAYLIHGVIADGLSPLDHVRLHFWDSRVLAPVPALEVVLTECCLVAAWFVATSKKMSWLPDRGLIAALAIGSFVVVESVTYAHFKVEGPHTRTFPDPFRNFNYMNVDRTLLRPPLATALQDIGAQLQTGDFSSMVVESAAWFPLVVTPHVSEFWHLRMLGGYGTGVSKRLANLPWPAGIATARTIEINELQRFDRSLLSILAFLNVKYLLMLTPDIYFNTNLPHQPERFARFVGASGLPAIRTMTVGGVAFDVIENPVSALPRQFLAGSVTGDTPALRTAFSFGPGETPASGEDILFAFDGQTRDLRRQSFAEGIEGTRDFDSTGSLRATYRGDVIEVAVDPSPRERFLVINQTYNSGWRASATETRIPVFPTNHTMLGMIIPPATANVQLKYEPLSSRPWALFGPALAVIALFGCGFAFRRKDSHWQPRRG